MKKQKAKGQKAGAAKKPTDSENTKDEEAQSSLDTSKQPSQSVEKLESGQDDPKEQTTDNFQPEEKAQDQSETPSNFLHNRQSSLSLQSRMRSSSFRRTSISQDPLSPNGTNSPDLPMLSPDSDSVSAIYRKQAARLDELEKENKRLQKELQEAEKRWRRSEEELEDFRESSGEVAELKSKAQKAEAQLEELTKMVCFKLVCLWLERKLIVFIEAGKHISSTPKLPASVPKQAPCLFSKPSQRIIKSLVLTPGST